MLIVVNCCWLVNREENDNQEPQIKETKVADVKWSQAEEVYSLEIVVGRGRVWNGHRGVVRELN